MKKEKLLLHSPACCTVHIWWYILASEAALACQRCQSKPLLGMPDTCDCSRDISVRRSGYKIERGERAVA